MKYGFVIDNRKCIGCHACTTACKSEHDVAVGVNRTWVKQVEKGAFPNTRRLFSVMRCNHCSDAPCVEICPVEALYVREDGIVDFDKDRCIACKSCMQACPYDALYIDPDTHTAAKCNYCAHRVDIGLEPACVNVCPEHAIISGDMEDPGSEISLLLSRQAVKVRKPEKDTKPNLFYIDADDVSIIPSASEKTEGSLWGAQRNGVGHFAKEAEKLAYSNPDVIQAVTAIHDDGDQNAAHAPTKSIDVLLKQSKEVYNTPNKGILWGWEVSAYIWTKSIAAGVVMVPVLLGLFGFSQSIPSIWAFSTYTALLFLLLTGVLLIKDLDQPRRFAYVLLRPQWNSWLVKGAYAITAYGGLLSLILIANLLDISRIISPLYLIAGAVAVIVAIYTAMLFAQAKGRDFWQSPALVLHMFIHAVMAGLAVFLLYDLIAMSNTDWLDILLRSSALMIILNLAVIFIELTITHSTRDAHRVVEMITKGRYKRLFWIGVIGLGNLVPLILIFTSPSILGVGVLSVLVLVGVYLINHIWVEAPQRIPLS